MTTIAASTSTPLTFSAGGLESLSDLDSQMEQRKQERILRRQERERKRLEDMKRSEDETKQTPYHAASAAQDSKPQPTNTKSSEKLQKLDKELEEMRRMRQSRRTPMVQMGNTTAVASQPVINKEKSGQNSVLNTNLLSKSQNKANAGPISQESVLLKSSPKISEAPFKISTIQDDNMLQENKISVDKHLTKEENRKVATSTDVKVNIPSKVQPKKSVLSRYSIAIENPESKQTQQSKHILPARTTSSLAERAAIFSTVQQAEATPIVNKRKSTSVLKFPSMAEKSDSDENSSSISPSVCVSHRFGQSPQIIKRRSMMLDDQAATIGLKKTIVGALKNHPSLEVKAHENVICAQGNDLQIEQELCLSSSPTEIKSMPVIQQQNLMQRDLPPLQHAKKPMSPRVQKKRQSPTMKDSVRPSTNTWENMAKVESNHDEGAQKVVVTGNEISIKGKQTTEKESETKPAIPEDIKADLSKVTLRSRVQVLPKELKVAEENEAKAIRERILAKRKSSSALNIQMNKSCNGTSKVEEPTEHQFMKIRAKLGRQGTESFRNATEKKIQELASGRRLKDTVHRWSTTDIPTSAPKQENQSQNMQLKQDTADEIRRPALSVLPHSTVSTSAMIKNKHMENTLQAEPFSSTQASKQIHKVDRSLQCEKVSRKHSDEQQCTNASSIKSQTSSSETRTTSKSVSYLRESIVTAKLNDRVKKSEPAGRASLKKRAYSSSDLKAIRKAFEQVNTTEKPIASKRSSSQDINKQVTMEVATPVKKVHDIHQTSVSNLQIVSPTPRKPSPEAIKLANKADYISKVEPQAEKSPLENQSWSTRKVLPSKLDMMQLNIVKPKEQLNFAKEKHSQRKNVHVAEKSELIYDNNSLLPADDYHNQELASNAVPSRSMNSSPTGSDDSSLLDTPKEGKKVSFSPTITTFRLDPEDEYDESNQDYFKTKGSSRKEGAYSDIDAISELPPPMEPLHQYNHQQAAMPSGGYSFADEKRDTSAFWKAFSSEMTNVSHMYSERDSRGSMLPPPDHPDNYYSHDQKQKSSPSWVKKSLEGGRPEPVPAAPSMWRNSGIWDNLFGRKSTGDNL